jgi:oligopeptide/dipeptide ABC transporter ATP-binding protein
MTGTRPTDGGDVLRVEGLRKHYPIQGGFFRRTTGWVRAVENVSLAIPRGRTLGLVGESGCGKTTLARMILKLLPSDSGRILFKGADIAPLSDAAMRPLRREIQIVCQAPYGSLNPRMTVHQARAEGLRTRGIRGRAEVGRRVAGLLEMVGLSPDASERFPHEFSGGQRQRIGIARALSVEPSLIVCDEPVSALDVSIQAQILNLLKDLQDRLGLTYLFISHDLNVVGYLCHHVAVMYQGQIVEYAATDELFERPLHPYTHVLLAAAPDFDSGGRTAAAPELDEPPAAAAEEPDACRFRPKCAQSDDRCGLFAGELVPAGPDHYVRCWRGKSP